MAGKERAQRFRQIAGVFFASQKGVWCDQACPCSGHAQSLKKIHDLLVHADYAVEAPQYHAGQRSRSQRLCFGQGRVSAGMKSENCFLARRQTANQSQTQDPAAEQSADVKMKNVIAQTKQQPGEFKRVSRIVNFICFLLAMPRNIDDRAPDSALLQKAPDGDQIGFHSSVRRRVWAKQKYSHAPGNPRTGNGDLRTGSTSSQAGSASSFQTNSPGTFACQPVQYILAASGGSYEASRSFDSHTVGRGLDRLCAGHRRELS